MRSPCACLTLLPGLPRQGPHLGYFWQSQATAHVDTGLCPSDPMQFTLLLLGSSVLLRWLRPGVGDPRRGCCGGVCVGGSVSIQFTLCPMLPPGRSLTLCSSCLHTYAPSRATPLMEMSMKSFRLFVCLFSPVSASALTGAGTGPKAGVKRCVRKLPSHCSQGVPPFPPWSHLLRWNGALTLFL